MNDQIEFQTISVSLDTATYDELNEVTSSSTTTRSAVVRMALQDFFETVKKREQLLVQQAAE